MLIIVCVALIVIPTLVFMVSIDIGEGWRTFKVLMNCHGRYTDSIM